MMKKKQKNAIMLKERKEPSFQAPCSQKDPHCYDISEKSIDLYNRLYDYSKHQQKLGKKKRAKIAQAIKNKAEIAQALHFYQNGMMKTKQINAMVLNNRKEPSFQVRPYSQKDPHCYRILEKSIDLYNRLYDYSKHQQKLGKKKRAKIAQAVKKREEIAQAIHFYQNGMMKTKQMNVMVLNDRKAANCQVRPYSKKDPHCYGISEKSIDVYDRLYDDSKHQQKLGKKKRVEITEVIRERRRGLRTTKKLPIAKVAELYNRQMEQVYATEQKKVELARSRGVIFIVRHIKV